MFASGRVAATRALSRQTRLVANNQKRTMGGGGPKPEWTGIDAKVRAVFPEDYQCE